MAVPGMPADKEQGVDPDTTLGIAAGLDVVLLSEDEVLIRFGTRSHPSELLRDHELRGVLGRIFGRLLAGDTTFRDLLSELPETDTAGARLMIADLVERGIITDIRSSSIDQYLRYTFGGESSLGSGSVTVIGLGPIGVRLAHSLLEHGIGRVNLLDDRKPDTLWRTLLPRNLADMTDDGKPIHFLVRDRLAELGYATAYAIDGSWDVSGLEEAMSKSHITVLALERANPRIAHLVNRVSISLNKPWIVGCIDGSLGIVGPLFLPFKGACYNCYETLSDATINGREMNRKYRQHLLNDHLSKFFPGLPSFSEILSGFLSIGVVSFLTTGSNFFLSRNMTINFSRMIFDVEDILKLPRCPVCGSNKAVYRAHFSPDILHKSQRYFDDRSEEISGGNP